MTGAELTAFRERMGWTKREAARMLGLSRNQMPTYEGMDHVPLIVALACSARAHGLPPYGSAAPGDPE